MKVLKVKIKQKFKVYQKLSEVVFLINFRSKTFNLLIYSRIKLRIFPDLNHKLNHCDWINAISGKCFHSPELNLFLKNIGKSTSLPYKKLFVAIPLKIQLSPESKLIVPNIRNIFPISGIYSQYQDYIPNIRNIFPISGIYSQYQECSFPRTILNCLYQISEKVLHCPELKMFVNNKSKST